jgi:hypothetical protein
MEGKLTPSGKWNYHHVQANLSVLVGHGDVQMTPAQNVFSQEQGLHDTNPVPLYWIKEG